MCITHMQKAMHSKHEHCTAHIETPRKIPPHPYSFYPVYIHGGSTRSPFVSELGTMHQAMARALVKAQRRATCYRTPIYGKETGEEAVHRHCATHSATISCTDGQ
jgi:hypothetical protein